MLSSHMIHKGIESVVDTLHTRFKYFSTFFFFFCILRNLNNFAYMRIFVTYTKVFEFSTSYIFLINLISFICSLSLRDFCNSHL